MRSQHLAMPLAYFSKTMHILSANTYEMGYILISHFIVDHKQRIANEIHLVGAGKNRVILNTL